MAVEFIDRLIVVMEQGDSLEQALNFIDKIINSMTKTVVIFLSQTGYVRRNS